MTLVYTLAKGKSCQLHLQIRVKWSWNIRSQDERQALQRGNIFYILYISDSSDRSLTKVTNGLTAVQVSVGLREIFLLLNLQTPTPPPPCTVHLTFSWLRSSGLGFYRCPLSSVEVKNEWICTYNPAIILHGVQKIHLTYTHSIRFTLFSNILLIANHTKSVESYRGSPKIELCQ